MKKSLAHLCAALILTTSFPALASDIPKPDKKPHFKTAATDTLPQSTPVNREVEMPIDFTISKIGDTELSCGALSTEAQNMRDIIYIMEDEKTSSKLKSHGVTAAGAVGSLLIGTATGGVGLALGGFLLDQNFKDNKEKADEFQDIAEQRRTLMMGIFNAKGCEGPIEHAMQNPAKFDPTDLIAAIEPAGGQTYYSERRKRYND